MTVTAGAAPGPDDIVRVLPSLPFAGVDPREVRVAPLGGRPPVVGGTAGLWRASAAGGDVVVKVLHCGEEGDPRWRPGDDEDHWYYWRREALVYESGLLDRLRPSMRAPRIYAVDHMGDAAIAIWMEYVHESMLDRRTDAAALCDLAFRLGETQARYTVDVPGATWLSRHWLRDYVAQREDDAAWLDDATAWRALERVSPLSSDRVDDYRLLWEKRLDHVAELAAEPRTLNHFDMHPQNVLVDATGTLVLVDWSFAGLGAIGEDVGNLHPDSVLDFHGPPADLLPMYDAIADRYHAGLRSGGHDVDLARVRRNMAATTVAKYAWIVPSMLKVAATEQPTLNGRPIAEAMPVWAATADFLVRLQRVELGQGDTP